MSILGIDPGLHGGLALLNAHDGLLLEPMPRGEDEVDLPELNRFLSDHAPDIRMAFLETMRMPFARRADGTSVQKGTTGAMSFGYRHGVVEALLVAHRIPYQQFSAGSWMKVMHEGMERSIPTKVRSERAFRRIFPGVDGRRTLKSKKFHDGIMEAALIAEFGRRILG